MPIRTALALACLLPLTACDKLGKKLGEKMYNNMSVEADLLFVCPDGLESLYDQIAGKQQAFKEKKSPSAQIISAEEDSRLGKIVEGFRQRLKEIEGPESPVTKVYGQNEKKIEEAQAKARVEYFQALQATFPKLVGACADTYRRLAKECQAKYADHAVAAHDCRKFYGKRALWEMIKLTKLYTEFTEQELKLLRPQFEETFETYLEDLTKQSGK